VRIGDFLHYYCSTFGRSYLYINPASIIEDETTLTSSIDLMRRKTFRGYCILAIDVECVNRRNIHERRKLFIWHEFPTHEDYPENMARWIIMSTAYGDNFIVDASKINPAMVSMLVNFWCDETTIVVGFAFDNDIRAFNLAFGSQYDTYQQYTKLKSVGKASKRRRNILDRLRVFDLSLLLDEPDHLKLLKQAGIEPEGRSLYHFGQAAVGVDIVNCETTPPKASEINRFWDVAKLSPIQVSFILKMLLIIDF